MNLEDNMEMLNETISFNNEVLTSDAKTGGPSFSQKDAFHLKEAEKVRSRENKSIEKRSL